MSLVQIYELPESHADCQRWSFAHSAHHDDVIRVIQQTKGIQLNQFLLDPVDPDNMGRWLYWHQVMHQETDAVLSVQSNDLLNLDWNDEGQLQEWITFNGNEHYQWSTILGV